jgi:flagellar assembly protein FliH
MSDATYQLWMPQSLDEAPATATPEALPAGATPAPELKWPTADELEQIHQEAHREGYAAGYEEGTARVRMEAARLHTLVEQLEGAIAAWNQEVAAEVAALGIEIGRQLVGQSLATRPEFIIDVVREAMAQLPHQHTQIFLNAEDAQLVRAQQGDQLAHAGHRIFEDATLSRGGCRVEASGSQIDGSIETRWRRVVEPLMAGANWQAPTEGKA